MSSAIENGTPKNNITPDLRGGGTNLLRGLQRQFRFAQFAYGSYGLIWDGRQWRKVHRRVIPDSEYAGLTPAQKAGFEYIGKQGESYPDVDKKNQVVMRTIEV